MIFTLLLFLLRLFSLNRTSGLLSVREGAPVGSYQLQFRVSEPVWPDVTCTAQVDIMELQPEALQSSASLRLTSESAGGVVVSTTWLCQPFFLLPFKSISSCFLQT